MDKSVDNQQLTADSKLTLVCIESVDISTGSVLPNLSSNSSISSSSDTACKQFSSVVVDVESARQAILGEGEVVGPELPQQTGVTDMNSTHISTQSGSAVSAITEVPQLKTDSKKKKRKKNRPKSAQSVASDQGAEKEVAVVQQGVQTEASLGNDPTKVEMLKAATSTVSNQTKKKRKKKKNSKSAQQSASLDLVASETYSCDSQAVDVSQLSDGLAQVAIAETVMKKDLPVSTVTDGAEKETPTWREKRTSQGRFPVLEKVICMKPPQEHRLPCPQQPQPPCHQPQHHNHPHHVYNVLHNHYPHFPHPHNHTLPQMHLQQHPHSLGHSLSGQGGHTPQGQRGHTPQGQRGHIPKGHQQHHQGSAKKEHQKKNIFESYWPAEKVSEGLKRGTLIEGRIRINPKNYEDAYVPLPDGTADIYICGLIDRNRAMNGDIVAVLVGHRDEWRVFTEEVSYYEETTTGMPRVTSKPATCSPAMVSADQANPDCSSESAAPPTVQSCNSEQDVTQSCNSERAVTQTCNSTGKDGSLQQGREITVQENSAGSINGKDCATGGAQACPVSGQPEGEEKKEGQSCQVSETVRDHKTDDLETLEVEGMEGADVVVEEEEEVELDSAGNPIEGTTVKRAGTALASAPPHVASPSGPSCPRPGRSPGQGQARAGKGTQKSRHDSKNSSPRDSGSGGGSGRNTPGSPSKKRFMSVKEVMEAGSPVARQLFGGERSAEGEDGQEVKMDRFLQRTGKVVAIIEKKHSRAASGTLRPLQDSKMSYAIFSPTDSRIPRIMIHVSELPEGFKERPEDFSRVLFIARITEWNESSKMPRGSLARSLGEAGQVEPETEALLMENSVDFSDFAPEVLACLPQDLPWTIPAEELQWRRDLRKECVFTIDPVTARDLDDALHCKYLGDGVYEVGVHIADVSYFVKEGTALDEVAMSRATSVYLVQKVIPMLPRLLCEQLCSLNPDEDRLTFSVIWKMTEQGEILEEWFGRSVIRSCVKLSYDHAQGFIEEPSRHWTTEEVPPISEGFTVDDIKSKVLQMDKMARAMRKARFDSGALRLDQVKIQYTLNKETGLPNGYSVYEQRDSNKLVEEFMLLANMAVAHKIKTAFRSKAVLRRHPPPQSKMIDELKAVCDSLGYPISVGSAKEIQMSLSHYAGEDDLSRARLQVLVVLCSKPMQNARYFCCGVLANEKLYQHYALNVPLYTHFTSPIRRYPDILVHRTLSAALGYCEVTSRSSGELHKIADVCNEKKANAKTCSERSNDLYFAIFVKEAGPLEEKGMVMAVLDKSFDVYILKLGVVKRVYCEKLPLARFTYQKEGKRPELTLVWNADDGFPRLVTQKLSIFSCVDCLLQSDKEPLRWSAIIRRPQDGDPTLTAT